MSKPAPDEMPVHQPHQTESGWYYRCDKLAMTWGPFPTERSIVGLLRAHYYGFPECRSDLRAKAS